MHISHTQSVLLSAQQLVPSAAAAVAAAAPSLACGTLSGTRCGSCQPMLPRCSPTSPPAWLASRPLELRGRRLPLHFAFPCHCIHATADRALPGVACAMAPATASGQHGRECRATWLSAEALLFSPPDQVDWSTAALVTISAIATTRIGAKAVWWACGALPNASASALDALEPLRQLSSPERSLKPRRHCGTQILAH